MKKLSDRSRFKPIFQATSFVFVLGLCFNSTSAYALKLSILGNNIKEIPGNGVINFHQNSGSVSFKGTVIAKRGLDTLSGVAGDDLVNGLVLELTNLDIVNNSSSLYENTRRTYKGFLAPLIRFENNFGNLFQGNVSGFAFFDGSFEKNKDGLGNLNSKDLAIFNGTTRTGNDRICLRPGEQSCLFPALGVLLPPNLNKRKYFFDLETFFDLRANQVNNKSISGEIRRIKLGGKETFNLPTSACIVMTDNPDFTVEDARFNCDRTSIPEPSSTISMLTLGVLGGGLLLKRRHKSSNS